MSERFYVRHSNGSFGAFREGTLAKVPTIDEASPMTREVAIGTADAIGGSVCFIDEKKPKDAEDRVQILDVGDAQTRRYSQVGRTSPEPKEQEGLNDNKYPKVFAADPLETQRLPQAEKTRRNTRAAEAVQNQLYGRSSGSDEPELISREAGN